MKTLLILLIVPFLFISCASLSSFTCDVQDIKLGVESSVSSDGFNVKVQLCRDKITDDTATFE